MVRAAIPAAPAAGRHVAPTDEGALTRAVEAALRARPNERPHAADDPWVRAAMTRAAASRADARPKRAPDGAIDPAVPAPGIPAWASSPTDQQPVLAIPTPAAPVDAPTEAPTEVLPLPLPERLDDLPVPGDYTPPPDVDWPTGHLGRVFPVDTETPDAGRPRRKRLKHTRRPAAGLLGLILFAFAGAFFAWFAAGPLWLTLGHRHPGTAVVGACSSGRTDRLCGEFTATDQSFTASVTLLAASGARPAAGTRVPAYMVSRTGSMAYAGDPDSFYLRWVPGVALTVLCGLGIAWSTGAFRLRSRRAKVLTALASVAGPILVLGGMLAVSW